MTSAVDLPELKIDGIRYAAPEDVHAIAEIAQSLLDEHHDSDPIAYGFYLPPADHIDVLKHFATNLARPDSVFLIRETKGKVHAFMQCDILRGDSAPLKLDSLTIDIPWFATRSGRRSEGHGSALIVGLRQLANDLGARQVRLRVFVFNSRAIEFYQRCGFTSTRIEMVARPDSLC